MEIRLTPIRIVSFLLLFAAFWWIGGFEQSTGPLDIPENPRSIRSVTIDLRIVLFVTGAVCTTVVEHKAGAADRMNLRPLYIVLGIILMACAVIWTRLLHSA